MQNWIKITPIKVNSSQTLITHKITACEAQRNYTFYESIHKFIFE